MRKLSGLNYCGWVLMVLGLVFASEHLNAQESAVSPAVNVAESSMIENLDLEGKEIFEALDILVEMTGMNIEAEADITGQVTVCLKDIEAMDALRIILDINNLAYSESEGVIHIMTAQDFQQKYSHPFNDEIQAKIITLSYIEPADAAAALNDIKNSYGKIFISDKTKSLILLDDPSKNEEMTRYLKTMDLQRFTMVFELGLAKAADLRSKVEGMLTPYVGRIKIDEASNKLIVTDTATKIEEIRKIVNAIDQRDRLVTIETKIVQIYLNDEHLTGVDWEAIVSDYKSIKLSAFPDRQGDDHTQVLMSIGTIANEDVPILMEALETVGIVEVLSSPSVTTHNNKEARILSGTGKATSAVASGGVSGGLSSQKDDAGSVDLGIKIFVTPAVHANGLLTMAIRPEVSSVFAGHRGPKEMGVPVIETSQGQTDMGLKNGVTVVIGGLIKEEKSKITKKVPFLGDVPFLGMAFRTYSQNVKKSEIIVFMTPIVSEVAAADNIGK